MNNVIAYYTEEFKLPYGKGFYGVLDKEVLGEDSLESTVPIQNFFMLDYAEFVNSPLCEKFESTKETFLKDQYYHFKLKGAPDYTSVKNFISSTDVITKAQGVVFEEKGYGKVLLAFDARIVTPVEKEELVFEGVIVDIIGELPEEEPEEEICIEEPEEEDYIEEIVEPEAYEETLSSEELETLHEEDFDIE